MRLLRAVLTAGFVVALVAAFYRIYLVPTAGWAEWALLTVGVAILGGMAIGKPWAIWVALAVNVVLALLLVAVVLALNPATYGHPEFLLVQILVSTGATAAAIRVRESLAASPTPS